MAIVQEFDLNMIPDSAPVVIHVDQYDKGTGRLRAILFCGDTSYTPSNTAEAIIQGTKPDNNGFAYNARLSGNVVTADLTDQMTAVPGRVRVNIVINDGADRVGSFAFWLDVQPTGLTDGAVMSESDYSDMYNIVHSGGMITTQEFTAWRNQVNQNLEGKQDVLSFDEMPTLGSKNVVTSNGIRIALDQCVSDSVKIENGNLIIS